MFFVYALLAVLAAASIVFYLIVLKRTPGQRFDSDGVQLYYTDEGSGVPIILVHGFGVHSDLNWRRPGCVGKLRQRGYRVITVDVRGHGRSAKPHTPEAYGTALSDDVVRLMDHLGIAKAHLAGYSMGGFITLKTIQRHPDRLLSGIICAAGWSTLDTEILALFEEIVKAMDERKVFDPITHWLDPKKRAPAIQCAVVNFFMNKTNDVNAIVNVFRTFEALSVDESALRVNTVPALTLVGTRDGIKDVSDKLTGLMANHELVTIPGGDHLTTILHPKFMKSMLDFLDAHPPQAAAM